MSIQYIRSLDANSNDVNIANTAAITSLYSKVIDGNLLGNNNRIEWEMSGAIGFNGANTLTLYAFYGGVTVSSCTVGASGAASDKGLYAKVILSADGSSTSQFSTIESFVGLAYSADTSVPVGWGRSSINSGSDQTYEVKGKWNAASAGNTVTHSHSTLTLLGWNADPNTVELDEPTLQILTATPLNNLNYTLRKNCYFYASLEHELTFYGYGGVTFTRAGSTVATWRDGASHTVAANQPRFEYNAETPVGMAIASSETLTFDPTNNLHDSNTICWIQDEVYKSTKRGDSNPFNSSGVWIGSTGVNIKRLVKFNKVLSTAEDNMVAAVLS